MPNSRWQQGRCSTGDDLAEPYNGHRRGGDLAVTPQQHSEALPESTVRVLEPWAGSAAELAEQKGDKTISVCLPARNEEATVGPIVEAIVDHLIGPGLVDELLVLDDGSSDDTARVAKEAGAEVVAVSSILSEQTPGKGKGNVLWRSIAASSGDLIVWCDTDLTSFTASYVTRLVAPLLFEPQLAYLKGYYVRPLDEAGRGGGRTTELVARPLLSFFFPPLATMHQPLGGESAARRELLEQVPFVESYGVEIALLIDALRLRGIEAMAQVDLGERRHRHRDLGALSEQASEILAVVLDRAGVGVPDPLPPLITRDGIARPVNSAERPPMLTVESYRWSRRH